MRENEYLRCVKLSYISVPESLPQSLRKHHTMVVKSLLQGSVFCMWWKLHPNVSNWDYCNTSFHDNVDVDSLTRPNPSWRATEKIWLLREYEEKMMNLRRNVVGAVKWVKIMKTQYSCINFFKNDYN